jgi:hypothetical protein
MPSASEQDTGLSVGATIVGDLGYVVAALRSRNVRVHLEVLASYESLRCYR